MFFTSRNKELASKIQHLENLEKKAVELNIENKELLILITEREKALKQIIAEKAMGFPWLSDAISEFHRYLDEEIAYHLTVKSHPAYKSAENVRLIANENRLLRKQMKIAINFVNYYETLFPWINEYVGEDLDDILESLTNSTNNDEEENDPVLRFITQSEFQKLSSTERNQKALDRYLASRKKPYEIGRDYERYIGYLYENKGYKVEYIGIEKGLEDMGRDLICIKGNSIEIIQCKCWAQHKTIHEKHINQLYGTAVKYYIERTKQISQKSNLNLFPDLIMSGQIKATFITSTKLSIVAKDFATALGITVIENRMLEKYPVIKCNLTSSGEKIYHLPFDQQYDRTLIKNKGEFYALNVEEAEAKGFRRAFRWQPNE